MSEIVIGNESDSKRCEICHQTDLYDPPTNFCQRCNKGQAYIPKSVKATHDLVDSDEDEILEATRKEGATHRNQQKIHQEQIAAKQKEALEIKAAARGKEITEWRIKNRKTYRELLDRLLPCAFPEVEQEILMARPFTEKLTLSFGLWGIVWRKTFSEMICAWFISVHLCFYLLTNFSPDASLLIVATIIWSMMIIVLKIPMRFVFQYRLWLFCFYFLCWNRKVNDKEVYFDPSVTSIRKEDSGSTELNVYPE